MVPRPCSYKRPTGINTLLSPLSTRGESETQTNKIQTNDLTAAELDDELHCLDCRIFITEITPVTSHIYHVVLLYKD